MHMTNKLSSSSGSSVCHTQGQNLSVISSRTHALTHLILCLPTLPLNYTCLNSNSDPLVTGPKPSMDYPLDNPSDLMPRSWISWCRALGFWVAL